MGHQPLRRDKRWIRHGLHHRRAVDGHAHGLPQAIPLHVGGHLVNQQHTHRGVAAGLSALVSGADDHIHTPGGLGRLRRATEQDLNAIGQRPPGVIVVGLLHQRQDLAVVPVTGAAEGSVAHEARAAERPILPLSTAARCTGMVAGAVHTLSRK